MGKRGSGGEEVAGESLRHGHAICMDVYPDASRRGADHTANHQEVGRGDGGDGDAHGAADEGCAGGESCVLGCEMCAECMCQGCQLHPSFRSPASPSA